jgi:hypothetical protein
MPLPEQVPIWMVPVILVLWVLAGAGMALRYGYPRKAVPLRRHVLSLRAVPLSGHWEPSS